MQQIKNKQTNKQTKENTLELEKYAKINLCEGEKTGRNVSSLDSA